MHQQEEQIAKLFGKILSEEARHNLTTTEVPKLSQATIDFILVKLREQSLADFQVDLDSIITTAKQHQAIIEVIASTMVLITYGATNVCPPSVEKRKQLVNALMEQLREKIAIVEGRQDTLVGAYGNTVRMTFGSILKNWWCLLKELEALEYGTTKEMAA